MSPQSIHGCKLLALADACLLGRCAPLILARASRPMINSKVKDNHSSHLFCDLLKSSYRHHDRSSQANVVLDPLRRVSDQFTRFFVESVRKRSFALCPTSAGHRTASPMRSLLWKAEPGGLSDRCRQYSRVPDRPLRQHGFLQ